MIQVSVATIKTIFYVAFISVLCAYMSKTDIHIKGDFPYSKDTLLFSLLRQRVNKIEGQTFTLYSLFGLHCLSFFPVIDWLFDLSMMDDFFKTSHIIMIIVVVGMFVIGVAISLIYSKIKKSRIVVEFEHNDEKELLYRVKNLEGLYEATKYMIFGTILLFFIWPA